MTPHAHATAIVESSSARGEWTARWAALRRRARPVRERASTARGGRPATGSGAWKVETTRTGARGPLDRARRHALDRAPAPRRRRHVSRSGPGTARPPTTTSARSCAVARSGRSPRSSVGSSNGYDSWSYAGVRADATPRTRAGARRSRPRAGALAVQALTQRPARHPDRLATGDGIDAAFRGLRRPTTRSTGSWGYETAAAARRPCASPPATRSCRSRSRSRAGPDALAVTERARRAAPPPRAGTGRPRCGWESWYHYGIRISTGRAARERAAAPRALRRPSRLRPGPDRRRLAADVRRLVAARPRSPPTSASSSSEIHRLDLRCGLWLAPFMVAAGRDRARHRARGLVHPRRRRRARRSSTGTTGGRSTRRTPRSSTTSATSARRCAAWGVDMVKLDFLYLGAQEGLRHDAARHRHRGVAPRARARSSTSSATTSTCSAAARRCCRWSASATPTASATTSRCRCIAREFGQPLTEGWTGWHGHQGAGPPGRGPLGDCTRRWFHCDPEIVMAWGSDGRGGAGRLLARGVRTPRPSSPRCAAVRILLADELVALLPEERAVLEDPAVLDLAWDERGFRPLDLFDHADTGTAVRLRPARRPRVGLGRRARRRHRRRPLQLDRRARHPHRPRRHDRRPPTPRRPHPPPRPSPRSCKVATIAGSRTDVRSGRRGVEYAVDVAEMVAAFVDGVLAEPQHGALGRGRVVVDAGRAPNGVVERGEVRGNGIGRRRQFPSYQRRDPARCSGRFTTRSSRPIGVNVGQSSTSASSQPFALDHEHVADVARVLQRRPDIGCRSAPESRRIASETRPRIAGRGSANAGGMSAAPRSV